MRKKGKANDKVFRIHKIYTVIMGVTISLSFLLGNVTVYAANDDSKTTTSETITQSEDASETQQEELVLESPTNVNLAGYDVVYVIDNSRSVWNQQETRNQAFKNISNLAIGSDIRIGVVYFADQVYQEQTLSLTSVETEEGSKKVNQVLDMYAQDKQNIDTNMGNALETAVAMFDSQDSSRKRAVILFSDGINENSKGQASYKEEADAKTLEQVQKLEKMNVPIYCVYLQKKRNDEEYLRQLVNYFDEGNDYTEERFAKVEESNIEDLKPTFTNMFYALQNNMKYRDITLDSTGALQFYVPQLGISKLRVYLDGDLQEGTWVVPAGESQKQIWSDGSAAFWAYTDPAPGNWSLNVVSPDLNQVKGTISYHANLRANAKLQEVEQNRYQLLVRFYDENGQEISIDKMARVLVRMHLAGDDGNITSQSVTMNIVDGVAQSDVIDLSAYGTYSFTVNLVYEDFINLVYELPGTTTEKHAPESLGYQEKWYELGKKIFLGEKTEEGIQFAIEEALLWSDPENEAVQVTEVVQLKPKNNVTVTQKDGYVYFTAQQMGNVEFQLRLEDTSGMTTLLDLKGNVWTRGMVWIVIATFVLTVIATYIPGMYRSWKVHGDGKRVSRIRSKWDVLHARYGQLFVENEQKRNELEALIAKVQEDVYTDKNSGEEGFLDLCKHLQADLRNVLGITEYADAQYLSELLASSNILIKGMPTNVEKTKSLFAKKNTLQADYDKDQLDVKTFLKAMETCIEELEVLVQEQEDFTEEIEEERSYIEKEHEKICELAAKVIDIIDSTITCDLQVETHDQKMGAKRCFVNNRYIQGVYALDDVKLLGAGTLGEAYQQTHIYVCGYLEESRHVEGLRLLSAREFVITDLAGQDKVTTKDVVLEKGTAYVLWYRNELDMERRITLTVK